ncbi:uncharacterized protein METZ01_LOCUS414489, partial [marine metagenome]
LDAGGEDFTISNGKTLTMETGSVTVLSGGTWYRQGILTLQSDSKVLYTTDAQVIMTGLTYRNVEHDGGTLSQGGSFTVDIFTNTSGNFQPGAHNLSANGIVWDGGSVTGTPSGVWDIGTGGVDANAGILVATSGAFTVAGNWDMTGSAQFIEGTGTVEFDGTGVQSITSTSGTTEAFYSVQISNTLETVSITDKFEINSGGTLTIDTSATFAIAGFEFDDNGGIIANNGTFEIHGDETFTTGGLSIPGNTKIVDPAGCTITTDIGGLEDVEFNSS